MGKMKILGLMLVIVVTAITALAVVNSLDRNEPDKEKGIPGTTQATLPQTPVTTIPSAQLTTQQLKEIQPNEAGKIMVVMFHNFVETFVPNKYDNGEYTMTLDGFSRLLNELYEKDYRPISLEDYLNNNISVPAGKIPIVLTFDDASPGQFHLEDIDGQLRAAPETAVGIWEDFHKRHPDFELKGVFYINLGASPFPGKGDVAQRLKYLIEKGFELGNHTLNHINLKQAKTAEGIQKEIGGNQKKIQEMIPGYVFKSFSLPFGNASSELQRFVIEGDYEGVHYKQQAIMKVGAEPANSPSSKAFNPLATARVRSPGIKPVQSDLTWWLSKLKCTSQYVSDGDANTITVPKAKEEDVDILKLANKKLVLYEP